MKVGIAVHFPWFGFKVLSERMFAFKAECARFYCLIVTGEMGWLRSLALGISLTKHERVELESKTARVISSFKMNISSLLGPENHVRS
jgi:hypothetical protein